MGNKISKFECQVGGVGVRPSWSKTNFLKKNLPFPYLIHLYIYTVVRQMSAPDPTEVNLTNYMGKYYTGDKNLCCPHCKDTFA